MTAVEVYEAACLDRLMAMDESIYGVPVRAMMTAIEGTNGSPYVFSRMSTCHGHGTIQTQSTDVMLHPRQRGDYRCVYLDLDRRS